VGKILQELRKNMIEAHKINLEYLYWQNEHLLKKKKAEESKGRR